MNPAQRLLALRLVAVFALYLLAAKAGLTMAVVGSTVTLVWAPSGIALAALLTFGQRMAFAVFLGALAANLGTGLPLPAVLSIATGNTLEAWIAARLLVRFSRFDPARLGLQDALGLIGLGALGSTLVSATLGWVTLLSVGAISAAEGLSVGFKWWLGDMMGMLVVTPALLMLLHRRLHWPTRAQGLEAVALLAGLLVVSFNIFDQAVPVARGQYLIALAVFPFVIWAALRFEQWGSSGVTSVVSLLAIWGTSRGHGPFVSEVAVDGLVRWCAFGIITAVTGLLLAASMADRRSTQRALHRSLADLEQRVAERTQVLQATTEQLQRETADNRRLETELIRVNEEQQQSLGRELHDGLGQLLTSLSLMCAAAHQRLVEHGLPEADALQRIREVVAQCEQTTHAVARGLYPVALEFGGLATALEQLAEHTRLQLGTPAQVHIDPQVRIAQPLVALNLYRVAQEAVSNAIKYSGARQLQLSLFAAGGRHGLSVRDDGIGIDLSQPAQGSGLGLASMRFRASLLGGHLDIRRTDDPTGTLVSVTYPIPTDHEPC